MNEKKLLYMSTHRGCKEMDIILGGFAAECLDILTEGELAIYEKLLSEPDGVIYGSIVKVIYGDDPELKYAESLLNQIVYSQDNRITIQEA